MTATMTESIYVREGRECRIEGCTENRRSMMRRDKYAFEGLHNICKRHHREYQADRRRHHSARTSSQVAQTLQELYPGDVRPCTACKEERPFSDFRKDATNPVHLQHRCRDCQDTHRTLGPVLAHRMIQLGISKDECIYCRSTDRITIEHLFTGVMGFRVPENLVYACLSCNSSKRYGEDVRDFLVERNLNNPHPLLPWMIAQAEIALSRDLVS